MKRGKAQAQIITTVLIILVVLVAVVIVWNVVQNMITESADDVDVQPFALDAELSYYLESGSGNAILEVQRGAGGGNISEVKLIFTLNDGSSITYSNNDVPGELEIRTYNISSSEIGLPNFDDVESVAVHYGYGDDEITYELDDALESSEPADSTPTPIPTPTSVCDDLSLNVSALIDAPHPNAGDGSKYILKRGEIGHYRDSFVIPDSVCDGGLILQLASVDNSTAGYSNDRISFRDVISNEIIDTAFTSEGVGRISRCGKSFDVTLSGDSDRATEEFEVTLVWSGAEDDLSSCAPNVCDDLSLNVSALIDAPHPNAGDGSKYILKRGEIGHYRDSFVIPDSVCDGGLILQLASVDNSTAGYSNDRISFRDVISNEIIDTAFTSEGVGRISRCGKSFDVTLSGDSDRATEEFEVTLVWSGAEDDLSSCVE